MLYSIQFLLRKTYIHVYSKLTKQNLVRKTYIYITSHDSGRTMDTQPGRLYHSKGTILRLTTLWRSMLYSCVLSH